MTQIAQVKKVKQKQRKEADAKLISTMLTGTSREKERAYATLYSEYIEYLNFFFSKSVQDPSTAADLAIESIGKAFKNIQKFDSRYAFSTWMQKIATNTLIDFKRKQEIEVQSVEELSHSDEEGKNYSFEAVSDALRPDEIAERTASHEDLHSKIANLKPRYKKLIKMRFLNELSYKEIAEALGDSVGTIKAQIFRAKNALAIQYED